MDRSNALVAAVGVVLVSLTAAAPATETLQSVIEKVDSNLYYPQKVGLRSLQADTASSLLDQMLLNNPEAKAIKLTYYWSQPYLQRFVLSGAPPALAPQAQQFEGQMSMWGMLLVPQPLSVALAAYKSSLREEANVFVIDAKTTAPSAFFWARSYTIDKKTMLPTRWHLSTAEWEADVDLKQQKIEGGKFVPVEMQAQAADTRVEIKLTYTRVQNWMLVESLGTTFSSGDGTAQASTLRLSNFRINQPIPAGIFPERKP